MANKKSGSKPAQPEEGSSRLRIYRIVGAVISLLIVATMILSAFVTN